MSHSTLSNSVDKPALTFCEREAIAQYHRTGDIVVAAGAWLGDDDETVEHAPRAVARLRQLLKI